MAMRLTVQQAILSKLEGMDQRMENVEKTMGTMTVRLGKVEIAMGRVDERLESVKGVTSDVGKRMGAVESREAAHMVMDVTRTAQLEKLQTTMNGLMSHKVFVTAVVLTLIAIGGTLGTVAALMWQAIVAWVEKQFR